MPVLTRNHLKQLEETKEWIKGNTTTRTKPKRAGKTNKDKKKKKKKTTQKKEKCGISEWMSKSFQGMAWILNHLDDIQRHDLAKKKGKEEDPLGKFTLQVRQAEDHLDVLKDLGFSAVRRFHSLLFQIDQGHLKQGWHGVKRSTNHAHFCFATHETIEDMIQKTNWDYDICLSDVWLSGDASFSDYLRLKDDDEKHNDETHTEDPVRMGRGLHGCAKCFVLDFFVHDDMFEECLRSTTDKEATKTKKLPNEYDLPNTHAEWFSNYFALKKSPTEEMFCTPCASCSKKNKICDGSSSNKICDACMNLRNYYEPFISNSVCLAQNLEKSQQAPLHLFVSRRRQPVNEWLALSAFVIEQLLQSTLLSVFDSMPAFSLFLDRVPFPTELIREIQTFCFIF